MQAVNLSYYLKDKGIHVINKKIYKDKNEEENTVFKQVENIVCFHNKIGPYKENLFPRIGGTIGKDINNYYTQIILVKKYLKILKEKDNLSVIDFYVINRGEALVKEGEKSIEHIYLNNFRELIERSMREYEVCLGRVDESNLSVDKNGEIIIGTTKYLSYNLREHDIYSYIKRVKRRETSISLDEVINYYIEVAKLKDSSKEYLRGLASFPNEEFRVLEKYIEGKLQDEDSVILESLNLARKIDGKRVII